MAQSLYDILGIDKNANQAEIKAAHRKLSKKYHPDLQGNKSEDEKKVEPKVKKEIKTIKRKNTIDKVSKIHIDLRKKEYLLKKWKPKGKGKVIGFRASVPECPLLNMTYQDKIRQYSERREESAEVKRELFNQRKEKEKAKMILKQSLEKKKTNEKFEITKLVNTIHNIYLSKK